jgi:hypothetical protein
VVNLLLQYCVPDPRPLSAAAAAADDDDDDDDDALQTHLTAQ